VHYLEFKQRALLADAIQSIIDEASTRKNAKGGLGLSKSRVNAYTSLKNILIEYQKHYNFKVKDVDVKFAKDFLKYLLTTKSYQKSYALKKIADLKTVCNDASFYGIETSTQLKKIDSSKTKNENILYLSPKELRLIEDAPLNNSLKNARKWLLLGCNIGQRGSDLLLLDETNFINRNGLDVIELKQQKTDKRVTIPVLEKTKEIIRDGLPYKISIQKFNKHIKEICRIAEINETLNNMLEFDEKGRMGFSDISQALKSHGINESNNKVGSYLKLLAPEGQEIKIKASNGVRHYKLKWRFNNGNQGTPY